MIKGGWRRWSLAIGLLAVFVASGSLAQAIAPPLVGHVTDQTGTLSPEQIATLEQTLSAFEARKGTQLAVLIISSALPEAIEQYALRVAESWKIGRKHVDDGVILVVAKDDRTLRIEVGYGLEGALSDIISKRIISETIVPRFKQGDFFGGIALGIDQIIGVIDGEPLPIPDSPSRSTDSNIRQFLPLLFILVIGVGGVLRNVFGKVGGSFITGAIVTGLAWLVAGSLLIALIAGFAALSFTLIGAATVLQSLGGMAGGRHGSGGGGFRGGGGGFGGGGASGRW